MAKTGTSNVSNVQEVRSERDHGTLSGRESRFGVQEVKSTQEGKTLLQARCKYCGAKTCSSTVRVSLIPIRVGKSQRGAMGGYYSKPETGEKRGYYSSQ